MTDDRIKNIKIAVHNEKESKKVQEKLFELGVTWRFGYDIVQFTDVRYLFVDKDLTISHCDVYKKCFDVHENREIYVQDLLALEPIENPKYVNCPMNFERVTAGRLGQKFGNNQSLFFSKNFGSWRVTTFDCPIETIISTTPTPRGKLEVGKWYYNPEYEGDFSCKKNKAYYKLVINYCDGVYIENGQNVIRESLYDDYWYEVVPNEY
jgi:hypothetical protein